MYQAQTLNQTAISKVAELTGATVREIEMDVLDGVTAVVEMYEDIVFAPTTSISSQVMSMGVRLA